jgi:hypothetical protein
MNETKCPKCSSTNWRCWDERDITFRDKQTGELFEMPVGYMACNECGEAFLSYDRDPSIEWMGTYDADYGWRDS